MTALVVWTVIVIALLIAGLAFFLYWVGTLLTRIAGNLEEAFGTAAKIVGDAKLIGPGVEHINQTGGGGPPGGGRRATGAVVGAVYSPIHSSFHDWSYCCSLQPGR